MPPLLALFVAGFSIATSSFIVAGLLPEMAADLEVSIPTAGLLVTAYGACVAVGGPILSLLTSHFPRKRTILALLTVFIVGQVFCALAPTYELLLGARLLISLAHGLFFGLASILAVALVPPHRRGMGISLVFAGITMATVIGVPSGTAIGHAFGWRAAFWTLAALASVAFIAIKVMVPAGVAPKDVASNARRQVRVLVRHRVWLSYCMVLLYMIANWTMFTYISPILTQAAHVDSSYVPWMLFVYGVGATTGLFAGGRLGDKNGSWTTIAGFGLFATAYGGIAFTMGNPTIIGPLLFIYGFAGLLPNASLQTRVLTGAGDAPDLAAAILSAMFNLGIAAGATLGAFYIATGGQYWQLPWIGWGLTLPCFGLAILAGLLDSRAHHGSRMFLSRAPNSPAKEV